MKTQSQHPNSLFLQGISVICGRCKTQKSGSVNNEVSVTLTEAKALIEQWRRVSNQVCPHSSLGYRPPAPEARIPVTLT